MPDTEAPGFVWLGFNRRYIDTSAGDTEEETPIGTYKVRQLSATDRAGNTATLKGAALEAKGWDLTFENAP